jgi:hypothetical protein
MNIYTPLDPLKFFLRPDGVLPGFTTGLNEGKLTLMRTLCKERGNEEGDTLSLSLLNFGSVVKFMTLGVFSF